MMCHDARLLLHAYLDDELDAAQSLAITRHVQECAACAASYAEFAKLSKAMAQPALYRRAPDALRKAWTPTASAPTAAATKLRRPPVALAMAAGFVAALLLTAPAWFYVSQRQDAGTNTEISDVVSSHIRSMQPEHLMDVVSTDQHTVKPWFDGKLDFAPRVKDLVSEGFPLIGGRLDALEGHSVAALIYKRRLHIINLYQWPASSGSAAEEATQWHGYNVICWTADRVHYVAVSDVSESELHQFVLAFQDDASTSVAR
ncbi:anti-sigma factor family protein [Dyella mobilis]|uniref:Anti-sigma factor n=1 Tax=Dyella mobilis TaxID=1849582 RepID=A0ABS2KLU8_9GAMM|nr:zf-HC2 domain-containing protein [Dyella mobilis]MBM7132005.1 anti-sigma factor [Dyella mobilis]GLQ96011.1 membrane protein [Dyella mobilis]